MFLTRRFLRFCCGRSIGADIGFGARLLAVLALLMLAGCGGDGGSGDSSRFDSIRGGNTNSSNNWVKGEFAPAEDFADQCAAPREGIDPFTGNPYPDHKGSILDENNWLRSWSNDIYLWYDEIVDVNPALYDDPRDYFAILKTDALTPSGTPKDQFHFTYDTDEWNALSSSGTSTGYGAQWVVLASTPPRDIRVAYTEPGSPATAAGVALARGTKILEINGIDVVNNNTSEGVALLNQALFPAETGLSFEFTVQDAGADSPRTVTLESAVLTSTPVQNVTAVATETGDVVGYIQFNDHIATAEQQLVNAVDELVGAGTNVLVLDLRYNGGGLLAISSELAYMIAGAERAGGEVFYDLTFNDKHRTEDPVTGQTLAPFPFLDRAQGFSAVRGSALPSLNLERIYILTGANTCSASEAIINGLRGVDVEVIQIGATTCGKPYGFYPVDNCGTTYFTVQFKGNNAKGFGEYSDGFSPSDTSSATSDTRLPGCVIEDDYLHALGDPNEARFAAALHYQATGTCPSISANQARQKARAPIIEGKLHKQDGLRNTILQEPAAGLLP